MPPSSTTVLRSGGVVKTEQFLREGTTPRQLRDAVVAGSLVRIRKGWYSLPGLDGRVEQAFRVGGVLACADAAVSHGLWVPRFRGLHVAVPEHASRLRDREQYARRLLADPDVHVHWSLSAPPPRALVQSLEDCIVTAASCLGAEAAFVLLESALHHRRLGPAGKARILARLPLPVRALLEWAGALSESGLESQVAFRLRRLGIVFRQQVRIGGRRVDFVIGEVLVLEADGAAFHDADSDNRRDAALGSLGYRIHRLRTSLIDDGWDLAEADIVAALSRGDHWRS
ncbi:type IV toxin-antitoxin system AbiEi family antitoxin domain-containing protein [Rathayibacter caricis]|uniref:type IV toxin-antitoxin system AbiEi family antitoxin domain-containing protein n=1 Tax=Rathayibacter caricis TaxID=110936 RepID=UPI0011B26425|nr:type IV toxin-antitoxin system AbiEi family antitoxin domain-containing protein [Rathayibacter caricis]